MLADFEKKLGELQDAESVPFLFQLGEGELKGLVACAEKAGIRVVDTIDRQLTEWVRTVLPAEVPSGPVAREAIAVEVSRIEPPYVSYGSWCFYPWRKMVTHLLPKDRFFSVRTNRNREKITHEEQQILKNKTIGVIGLSVGHAAAMVLAQEGLCGELRIADFDTLDLSNLNRLRTSLVNLGDSKVDIARRDLAEIDPYLPVKTFPKGVTDETITPFFEEGGKLDLLVEECDTLPIKLRAREKARALGIPVVMDTNDRGLLDVERFDRDANRPLMHGLMGDHTAETAKAVPPSERLKLFYGFFGGEHRVSPAFRESVRRIGKDLVSYPQLSSDVHLGAALVAHASRLILLGKLRQSGRFAIDLDQLINDSSDPLSPEVW